MRIQLISIAIVGFIVAGCASSKDRAETRVLPDSSGKVAIEQVVPFVTADSIRMQVKVKAEEPTSGIELAARIVPVTKGNALWSGQIAIVDAAPNSPTTAERRVTGLKPQLWEPASPNLYNLTVTASQNGKTLATKTTRFGFRSFEIKDAQFHLNGRPIFLRGIAINPPGRGIPEDVGTTRKFAEDYVRFMKSHGVNMIRMEPESPVWFDVCDELGMMVFQGRYGAPASAPGGRGQRQGRTAN